jgi:hypothetical protein
VRRSVTYRRPIPVRFEGSAARVLDFVAMLEGAGYAVEYTPPVYRHVGEDDPDDVATALLFVSGSGCGKTVSAVADELIAASSVSPIAIEVGVVMGEHARMYR